jgi:hypothetical protein
LKQIHSIPMIWLSLILLIMNESSCPLCSDWEPPLGKRDNANEFCQHLGRHLQHLSLAAVLILIEGLTVLKEPLATLELEADN